MVLMNQQTYYEPSKISETTGTGNINNGQDSVQLSTIRFNDTRTFMDTQSNRAPQIESSSLDHKVDEQDSTDSAPRHVV